DGARDDCIEHERAERDQVLEGLESTRATTARRRTGLVALHTTRGAAPQHRGNDGNAETDGRTVSPLDETMRVRAVNLATGNPIGDPRIPMRSRSGARSS